jgi:hypothetical protein
MSNRNWYILLGLIVAFGGLSSLLVFARGTAVAASVEKTYSVDIYAHANPNDACARMGNMIGLAYRQLTPWSVQLVCAGEHGVVELTQAQNGSVAVKNWISQNYSYPTTIQPRNLYLRDLKDGCASGTFHGVAHPVTIMSDHGASITGGRPICMNENTLWIGQWIGKHVQAEQPHPQHDPSPGRERVWRDVTPIPGLF